MRVLFLTHRLPYAPNRGDRTRAHHMLRAMSECVEVDLVSLVHDDHEETRAADLTDVAASVSTLRVSRLYQSVRVARAMATRAPLTHALLDAPGSRDLFVRLVRDRRPDVVLAYCSGMARFALDPPLDAFPLVLDMVDVDSEKWRELSARSDPMRRWVYTREARRLAAFERRASLRAAATLVVNAREGEALQRLAPSARIIVLTNGVDCDALRPPRAAVEEPRVLFTGVMDYAPNEEAARWLAKEVWPLVLTSVPSARLGLVGANPGRTVRSLERDDPTIHVTGTVPDVREHLWASAVAVAPLWTARGIQNKVLEAIAAGLPCVVTPAVAGGLPPGILQACMVAGDADTFASAIVALLRYGGHARRAIAALANVHEITWTAQLSPLVPMLSEIAGAPPLSPQRAVRGREAFRN